MIKRLEDHASRAKQMVPAYSAESSQRNALKTSAAHAVYKPLSAEYGDRQLNWMIKSPAHAQNSAGGMVCLA